MRIRLLTSRVGKNFSQRFGEVVEMLDHEARRMIDTNQAELAGEIIETPEMSQAEAIETATIKTKKIRKRKNEQA